MLASRTVAGMGIDHCAQPIDEHRTVATKGLRRKFDLQPKRSSVETHSLASVAKHNKPNDCWVIIREKVYNVTAWVPQHPGGALIYINAGKDCTQLFDSYHPLYVRYILIDSNSAHICRMNMSWTCCIKIVCVHRAVLDKFCIGTIAAEPGECAAVQYQQPAEQQQFYTVLRQRVEKFFRKNEVWRCVWPCPP